MRMVSYVLLAAVLATTACGNAFQTVHSDRRVRKHEQYGWVYPVSVHQPGDPHFSSESNSGLTNVLVTGDKESLEDLDRRVCPGISINLNSESLQIMPQRGGTEYGLIEIENVRAPSEIPPACAQQ